MIELGLFLDSYYAYDFNQPEISRRYTTQPVQHDRPAVNLAHVDFNFQEKNTRSRVALQAGDSVERNAVAEPGAEKYIQESYLGYKWNEKTWIDAGIFLGNIGAESWISKDNWTYSRALNLDYVPYYSAGIRLQQQMNENQSFQLQILNGWQNVSENNSSKAFGMQFKDTHNKDLTFTYNNFFGDEQVVSQKPRFRAYHNFILEWRISELWQSLFAIDLGHQSQQKNQGVDAWYSGTVTMRRHLSPNRSFAIKAEYFNDRHQTTVITKTIHGFQVAGASTNFDQLLEKNLLWRTELRGFYSLDRIYPKHQGRLSMVDTIAVTSLAVWF